jgi:hypothetical protein
MAVNLAPCRDDGGRRGADTINPLWMLALRAVIGLVGLA